MVWKHIWEKDKMPVSSIFSFSQYVFYLVFEDIKIRDHKKAKIGYQREENLFSYYLSWDNLSDFSKHIRRRSQAERKHVVCLSVLSYLLLK